MLRLSAVQTVTLVGFTLAVILDDFSGGPAASAAAVLAGRAGSAIEQRIGPVRSEQIGRTAQAAFAWTARRAAGVAAAISGGREVEADAQPAERQASAGPGLTIVVPE